MNKIIQQNRFLFSLFGSKVNEGLIRASIHTPLSTEAKNFTSQTPTYNVTKLDNGIRVLTQSVSVPSTVHLGVFVDYGSRDQTSQTSGALLSLKNTYLKTAINTSQTVNYGITQMSGGQFQMEYNRQNAYYYASCLSHDVVDVLSMVTDSALQPKNFVSTSVGMYKNAKSHKLETFLGGNQIFTDNIFQAAYGRKGLGMPIQGLRSNVNYLNASIIQKFQAENITPNRIVISAAGVQFHDQFVDVVRQKLQSHILPERLATRQAASYKGGQVRNLTEANNIHIVLAFQGANHKNSLPLLIAEEILGNNRKVGRIQRNILNKHVFVDGVQSINTNFSDTGLFGLKISGSSAHAKDILNAGIQQLSGLRNITGAELELAKQSLKGRLSRTYSSTAKRLQDRTKELYYTGTANENINNLIDNVSVSQVTDAVSKALTSPLTFVSRGGEVNTLPSYDSIGNRFN